MNEIYLQKSSNQEMFALSLSSCSRYNANFKLGQSVFAIHDSPLYYEISEEDDHPPEHARTHPCPIFFSVLVLCTQVNIMFVILL
jgi:hypothetical protein